ncbi:MAG: S-methyl-5-thioribose-1-phosphate isomerase [Elusimicrobia bacterium]|nr:S-methyl-5-thioribose-1-phosphate isomerase [Elusimicrobiota bacterium]
MAKPLLSSLTDRVAPLKRRGDAVYFLDQLLLPSRVAYKRCATPQAVADAIRTMVLRGAPLIGCAAAYGYAFAAKGVSRPDARSWKRLAAADRLLAASRPTAVNLFWALKAMRERAAALRAAGTSSLYCGLLAEADAITRADVEANRRMAGHGAALLKPGSTVMTICNTGALATAGIGTALGVVRWARRLGKVKLVYALETRPYLQGARLTMWELAKEGIPSRLITDGMAAHIMKTERVDAVLTGADRVAANGDAANKIGTYGLSLLAKAHGIPFYVVAPSSTVDMATRDGGDITIEERSEAEVLEVRGLRLAPAGARARHPAFDVTPARLITALVTDRGVIRAPYGAGLRKSLGNC